MLIQSSACHIVNSFSMSGSGCLPSSFRRFDWSSRVPAADAKKARRYIYICTQYYTHTHTYIYIYIYTHIYIYTQYYTHTHTYIYIYIYTHIYIYIYSFIHSGDLYSASSRDYYSEVQY